MESLSCKPEIYHGCPLLTMTNSRLIIIIIIIMWLVWRSKSSCFGVKSESYSILVGYSYKERRGSKAAIVRNWAEERNSKEAAIEYY
jgi:hypothetical protein